MVRYDAQFAKNQAVTTASSSGSSGSGSGIVRQASTAVTASSSSSNKTKYGYDQTYSTFWDAVLIQPDSITAAGAGAGATSSSGMNSKQKLLPESCLPLKKNHDANQQKQQQQQQQQQHPESLVVVKSSARTLSSIGSDDLSEHKEEEADRTYPTTTWSRNNSGRDVESLSPHTHEHDHEHDSAMQRAQALLEAHAIRTAGRYGKDTPLSTDNEAAALEHENEEDDHGEEDELVHIHMKYNSNSQSNSNSKGNSKSHYHDRETVTVTTEESHTSEDSFEGVAAGEDNPGEAQADSPTIHEQESKKVSVSAATQSSPPLQQGHDKKEPPPPPPAAASLVTNSPPPVDASNGGPPAKTAKTTSVEIPRGKTQSTTTDVQLEQYAAAAAAAAIEDHLATTANTTRKQGTTTTTTTSRPAQQQHPPPEIFAQMVATVVAEAAKKELEARLRQQQQQQQQSKDYKIASTATSTDKKTGQPASSSTSSSRSSLSSSPLPAVMTIMNPNDPRALQDAQAKLLAQANSLAKAQAYLQAQVKALERMQQQQQQQQQQQKRQESPVRSTLQTSAPTAETTAPSASSPSISPIDSLLQDQETSPNSATSTSSSNDWFARARSEAETKARALIQAAQEEAAARRQERVRAKALQMAQERSRLKAETEAKLREKAARDAWELEQFEEQVRYEERLKQHAKALAKAKAEAKLREKAEADAAYLQAMEEARAQAKAAYEEKLRQKALQDAPIFEQAALAEERRRQLQAKVRARTLLTEQEEWPLAANNNNTNKRQYLSAAQLKAQAIARGERAVSPPKGRPPPLPIPTPPAKKEFIPFGKSKGEDAATNISLFLQVPGVVHPSEVKVELEDGVLYISRGIIVQGLDGVQKYTRSFPFEEELLDTFRITVTLVPANATADGVSVLRFTLPKKAATKAAPGRAHSPSSWKIPIQLVSEENKTQEETASTLVDENAEEEQTATQDGTDASKSSLDVPDDEKSDYLHHQSKPEADTEAPEDEMAANDPPKVEETEQEVAAVAPAQALSSSALPDSTPVTSTEDKDGLRMFSIQVPQGVSLQDITAVYEGEKIRVDIANSPEVDYVFPLTSQEAEVRKLQGQFYPAQGLLVLQVPLAISKHDEAGKPKARRLRVYMQQQELTDASGVISVFGDDFSISSRGSASLRSRRRLDEHQHHGHHPQHSNNKSNSPLKNRLKKVSGLKVIASKYLKIRARKPKQQPDY